MSVNNWWTRGGCQDYHFWGPYAAKGQHPPPAGGPATGEQGSNDDTVYGKDNGDVPIGAEDPIGGEASAGGQYVGVVQTGTGTGHFFNVTNDTGEPQYFAFSAGSNRETGYANNVLAVMRLEPGDTGTFEAGNDVPGIRISTSGPNGETNPHQVLFEDTIGLDPMGSGKVVHNPDVSAVDGTVGYDGLAEYISISDGTRTIGHGTTTGVYDYDVEDQDPNWETNPMNMALNPATTYDIIFWK